MHDRRHQRENACPQFPLSLLIRLAIAIGCGLNFPCLSAVSQDAAVSQDVGVRIESETGGHTRVVWVQDQSRLQNDSLARGRNLMLMGLDSRDGKGERPILRGLRNYVKPLLTPTGDRIVYSDHFLDRVFVVDWDGGNRRSLCAGFALDVWQDPLDQTQWVYAGRRAGTVEDFLYRDVFRVRLDDPRVREPVWNSTPISPDNFQLSADGKRAAGEFPWPNSGIADLESGSWEKRSTGCWASIAPDNSYVCAVFDGPHRNWQLHSTDGSRIWKVNIAPVELFEGFEVFHPRWSNHVRFLALTGPYKLKGPINEITGGGPEVEIYIAKFTEQFDSIERWIQVTNNQRADFYPDVWIAGGQRTALADSVSGRNQSTLTAGHSSTPADQGLVFSWDSGDRPNEVGGEGTASRICRIEPRGWARFDSFFAMRSGAGFFELDEYSDSTVRNIIANNSDFILEMTLTPEKIFSDARLETVMELGEPGGNRLAIQQRQNSLVLVLVQSGDTRATRVSSLVMERPLHLVIASSGGRITCWIDGQETSIDSSSALIFEAPDSIRLRFGADLAGQSKSWPGRLERIRFYQQLLSPDQLRVKFSDAQSSIQRDPAPRRAKVQAQLVQSTPAPSPETLLPYRRALVIHHFRLLRTYSGQFSEQDFLVARWAILDGQPVGDAVPEPGAILELWLESMEDQRQLTGERQLIDIDQFDLPMYYDVSFPL
jgi:hypothetical protein